MSRDGGPDRAVLNSGQEAPAGNLAPLWAGAAQPLATTYDTALVDLDGVVYVGPHAVPGAAAAVVGARAAGMAVAYVTNNANRTPAAVAAHLVELGIEAVDTDVVTSAQAAARLLAAHLPTGAPVLVVGGEGLVAALHERGLRAVRSAADQPLAVAQGYSPDVGWKDLAEGSYVVATGVPWVASNTDLTIPTARGIAPGNGALVAAIAVATGRDPEVAGKPELPLHAEAMRRTGARRPLVVGDRLDTDIEGANRAGVASLLVLTGVTTPAQLVAAPPELRPTYLAADIEQGLLKPHLEVSSDGEMWTCNGWTARLGAEGLQLHGEGDPIHGLRAVCVAAWATGADAAAALARIEL